MQGLRTRAEDPEGQQSKMRNGTPVVSCGELPEMNVSKGINCSSHGGCGWGHSPVVKNTRGFLDNQWSILGFREMVKLTRMGNSPTVLVLCAEFSSLADGIWSVVEQPGPGSQPLLSGAGELVASWHQ